MSGPLRARALTALRLRAAAPAKGSGKKGKKAVEERGPPKSSSASAGATVGLNIFKEGSDPPHKPDSEYPEWLWRLAEKKPQLSELKRKDPTTMTDKEVLRLLKLSNRSRIKEVNLERAKV